MVRLRKGKTAQDHFLHFTQVGPFHEEWGRENRRPPCTTKTGSLFPRFWDAFEKKFAPQVFLEIIYVPLKKMVGVHGMASISPCQRPLLKQLGVCCISLETHSVNVALFHSSVSHAGL